jgi:hypothetical protein
VKHRWIENDDLIEKHVGRWVEKCVICGVVRRIVSCVRDRYEYRFKKYTAVYDFQPKCHTELPLVNLAAAYMEKKDDQRFQ